MQSMTSPGGHPKALWFLFLTEMWERFGFYVVQGLLILYLTQYFGYSDNEGYALLGVFSALVYISPLIGGLLADKILGFKNAILWGGLFLILGYFLLFISRHETLFYFSLGTIVIGNGLFKPNISSLLGLQYDENNQNLRDSGFTIFYVGINIGSLLAGLSSGYIKVHFGWHMSFGLASLGLIIGLGVFLYGLKYIKTNPATKPQSTLRFWLPVYCLLAALGVTFFLKVHALANWLLPVVGILLFFYLIVLSFQQPPIQRKRLLVLNLLIVSSIVFWTLYLQMFFSINLFADRLVEKNLFGIPLTTTIFYASEGMFIVLLGPFFARLWDVLNEYNLNPSPIKKFILGIFFLGLAFLMLTFSTFFPNQHALISPLWVFFSYFLLTIGELLLSPIGLSAVTLLAPPRLMGMMMGVWFVAIGFGGIFAGWVADWASVPTSAITLGQKLAIYQNAFLNDAYLAFIVAIGLFFMQLTFKRFLKAE